MAEDKFRFSDPEFYKENLEMEKIKNQEPNPKWMNNILTQTRESLLDYSN